MVFLKEVSFLVGRGYWRDDYFHFRFDDHFDNIFLHPSLPDSQENMILQEAIGTRLFDGESILFFKKMFFISTKSAFDLFLQTLH